MIIGGGAAGTGLADVSIYKALEAVVRVLG